MSLVPQNKYPQTTSRRINPMKNRQVPLMLSVPPDCRDKLRQMAARRNFRNPNQVTSASTIARELVLEGIERIERMEANLAPAEE
jgi:hypothetical protein